MKSKNLRLLGKEEAPSRQASIQEMIGELRAELAKGEKVCSSEPCS